MRLIIILLAMLLPFGLTSCKKTESHMLKINQVDSVTNKSYGSGFIIPDYATNIHRRENMPSDVFYFEIPQERREEFLKTLSKYSGNCKYTPSALEDYGEQFKERFNETTLCFEKNDGDAITYETVIVGKSSVSVPVFYAFWGS